MRKANGKAIHSMIKNATYVSGVTPPETPLIWFLDRLQSVNGGFVQGDYGKGLT